MDINKDKQIDTGILRSILSYDPFTGELRWLHRDKSMFQTFKAYKIWNGKNAGKPAFTSLTKGGYMQGSIFSKTYTAHRVSWAIHYGEWPEFQVDHINCIRNDNRICNLRIAENRENARNRGAQSNNTSGHKGVSYYKRNGKWEANICVDGISSRIGYFGTAIEASLAYEKACIELHGEFYRTH